MSKSKLEDIDPDEKWINTKPDVENQIYTRKVSPDGKLFIGIYRVLFGYRIRAGHVGRMSVEVDWCCGDNYPFMVCTYNMLLYYLESGGEIDKLPPVSRIKPWYKDPVFIQDLGEALEVLEPMEYEI